MYFWGIRNRDKQELRHKERHALFWARGVQRGMYTGIKHQKLNLAIWLNTQAHHTYIMRIRSQSGQIQVGPLLIPHLFSSKQSLQIINPQGQLQQNSCFCLQQWQTYAPIFLFLYPPLSSLTDIAVLLHKPTEHIHNWNCQFPVL